MESPKSEMVAKDGAKVEVGKTPAKPAAAPTHTQIKIGSHSLGYFLLPGDMDVRKAWDEFKAANEFEGDKPHAFPIMFPKHIGVEADLAVKAAKETIQLEI